MGIPFEIRHVDDAQLPAGHDWMLVRDHDHACVFVKRSRRPCEGCGACPIAARAAEVLATLPPMEQTA